MPTNNKELQRKYRREYYERNKESHYARNNEKRERLKDLIREAKNKPCADCNKIYPYYVMDLDHRDPLQKLFNPSKLVNHGSLSKMLAEIEKCDVVCSNCHRIRTYGH